MMMTSSTCLLASAVGLPLLLLLACAAPGLRRQMPRLFMLAPLPALFAAALAEDEAMLTLGGTGLALALDAPGRMLLGAAMVLWIFAGHYASQYMRERPNHHGFIVCWLMALTGCVGVFLAADLVSFYFLLAVLSVGASGLVLQGEGPQALRAGALYLGLALLAEAFLLAGLVLLAQAMPHGSLLISDAVAALPTSPWRNLTLLLLLIGLGMKAGLVPLHFWMPLAYGAAPIPAAAVLSGAVVKASIIALVRFLPFHTALPEFGLPLAAIGLLGALYGVAIGITQLQPKVVLAYSSVSQMGFVVAVIGMGLAAGKTSTVWVAAFYAIHHLLVKGALFLAIGVMAHPGRRQPWTTLLPAAIIALGLAGLPLTGGALTKYAAKDILGSGWAGTIAIVSSVATALLMLHFLYRLYRLYQDRTPTQHAQATIMQAWPWLSTALAAVVLPWMLYLTLPGNTLSQALAPTALWSGLWPVLTGAALAAGLHRLAPHLPRIPAGDLGVLALERLQSMAVASGRLLEQTDAWVQRWSVASITLLCMVFLFGWAFLAVG